MRVGEVANRYYLPIIGYHPFSIPQSVRVAKIKGEQILNGSTAITICWIPNSR